MIRYESGGIYFFLNIFKGYLSGGSVFPRAVAVATPCASVAVMLSYLIESGMVPFLEDPEESVLRDNAAWSGFSFLVGFLIVFRTSQSYNRFWDGCTSTHMMRAEWFDGCSSLLAFCRHSAASDTDISVFQNTLVRLFSMLHSAALADIEDTSSVDVEDVASFQFELLDIEGLDDSSLIAVRDSEAKVELIFQWIQLLVVENITTGVLSIPAPILSRSFQEIANGMVAFHDAMKISQIPFPFPYAQTCDFLLFLHWLIVPFVVTQWVKEAVWAFIFSFIQVFILWVLNMIAVELENPFGHDANDIDGREMQLEMNALLLLLMSPQAAIVPTWSADGNDLRIAQGNDEERQELQRGKSFVEVWTEIDRMSSANSVNTLGSNDDLGPKRSTLITTHRNSLYCGDGWGSDSAKKRRSITNAQSYDSEGNNTFSSRLSIPFPGKKRLSNSSVSSRDSNMMQRAPVGRGPASGGHPGVLPGDRASGVLGLREDSGPSDAGYSSEKSEGSSKQAYPRNLQSKKSTPMSEEGGTRPAGLPPETPMRQGTGDSGKYGFSGESLSRDQSSLSGGGPHREFSDLPPSEAAAQNGLSLPSITVEPFPTDIRDGTVHNNGPGPPGNGSRAAAKQNVPPDRVQSSTL